MMRVIWKYPFQILGDWPVMMPAGSRVLAAQLQGRQPCLWVEVDPAEPMQTEHFVIVGTGHPIRDTRPLRYIGTVQTPPFVWHVFQVVRALS